MTYTEKHIGTLTKDAGRASGHDVEGACRVALRHARRIDGDAFVVGTYFGLKITERAKIPTGTQFYRVAKTGEVYKNTYSAEG